LKEAVSPTSFRLPKSLLIELRTKCAQREVKQGEAVVAAISAWIGEEASADDRAEWLLESIGIGLSTDVHNLMDEEGRSGFRQEIRMALEHWIDPDSQKCRNEDIVEIDFTPDAKEFQSKIDAILNSGDQDTLGALTTTVDLFYARLRPVTARRKSGS